MKKLFILTLALSLPLAQFAKADNDKEKHRRQADAAEAQRGQQAAPPAAQPPRRLGRPSAQQSQRRVAPVQQSQRRVAPLQQSQRRIEPVERSVARSPRSVAPVNRQSVRSEADLNGRNRPNTAVTNREDTRNENVARNRGDSRGSVQRRGGNRNFDRNSFDVARNHVVRTRHDRNWWRSRYNTTFVLFGGGYYYCWNNYWYPAYGYSSYYNNYVYNEPIYRYDNLAPGQVLINVQVALRDAGYYYGAIDGQIGPQTRSALSAYQRDHGLVITAAIDEPTLVTLGLT